MKKIFFILLFPFFCCQAQPFLDVAGAYYQYSPADKPAHNHIVNTSLSSFYLTIPVRIDSDYIVFNPVYENFQLEFPESYVDRSFHSAYMPLTWLHQWNSKWKTAFVFIPRMNSRLEEPLSTKDFQWGGAILTSYQRSGNLKYKAGIYYNSEFFGPFVIPLLGIDWNVNQKWNVFGVLPGSMNVEYKFSRAVHAGILFRSLTNSYRTFDYNYIRVNDNHLKLFLDFYVTPRNVLSIEAGHTVLRRYRTGYRRHDAESYFSMNVTDGWLFKIAYSFRVRTDEPTRQKSE